MVNPQLLEYVRAQRAAGVSKEDITKALAGGGWSAQDAQEAFAGLESPKPPPSTPKPSPVQTSPQATIGRVSSTPTPQTTPSTPRPAQPAQPRPAATSPSTSYQPMGGRIQPSAVVQPRPVYGPQPKKHARWPWVVLGLLFSLVLGFAAGAYVSAEYEWVENLIPTFFDTSSGQESMVEYDTMDDSEDSGNFLEVSPDPFDTLPAEEENSTSTPTSTEEIIGE